MSPGVNINTELKIMETDNELNTHRSSEEGDINRLRKFALQIEVRNGIQIENLKKMKLAGCPVVIEFL